MTDDRARFLGRPRERPLPSFADALSAGGGAIVAAGVLLIAIDAYTDGEDGWKGALCFLALGAIALAALHTVPRGFHPGCLTALAVSIPAIFGFLLLPDADGFGEVRVFLLLTIATWLLLFVFTRSRGRPILLALAAIALYLWVLGEVTDSDAYVADPVPSPYAAPAEFVDGLRGQSADAELVVTARPAQETTIDDLDPSDPRYPLAEECAAGDLEACDELWQQSDIGSDFETFAESCGGSASLEYPCTAEFEEQPDDGFDGGFDDGFDDLDEFETPPLVIAPEQPFDDEDTLEIGLVSLAFGALYLAGVQLLDRRNLEALGTAFVVPAVGALVTAASALGAETESAFAGGLITFVVGVAIGVVGYLGDRRFTTWAGGAVASVGALIIAADVAPESDGLEPDLVGPGFVVLAFGLAVVGLAWVVHRFVESRFEEPPSDDGAHSDEPPSGPQPGATSSGRPDSGLDVLRES